MGNIPVHRDENEIIIYSIGGMPVEDVAWGTVVYRNALAKGIGTKLNLWELTKKEGQFPLPLTERSFRAARSLLLRMLLRGSEDTAFMPQKSHAAAFRSIFHTPYEYVTGVTIGEVDKNWQIIPGTEKHFDVDTICLAVGLSPMSKLADMAGCAMEDNPAKAGFVPTVDKYGATSVSGIYAAGDVSGIEESSSAMIEGRIAGIAAAAKPGFISDEECEAEVSKQEAAQPLIIWL